MMTYRVGKVACWIASLLGLTYVIVTILGFLSLTAPDEPIADPYFSAMEILTLLLAPILVICMIAIHFHAKPEDKIFSLAGVVFMLAMCCITSCVHFVILTVSDRFTDNNIASAPLVFSFTYPSVVYALDILSWDWFFGLSMLSAANVFKGSGINKTIRILMIISGVLSLAGLLGAALANMQIRNVGIVGYALMPPIMFWYVGLLFDRIDRSDSVSTKEKFIHQGVS